MILRRMKLSRRSLGIVSGIIALEHRITVLERSVRRLAKSSRRFRR